MVYVISKTGHPLMPTTRHGKVRRMLKEGKAKVVKRCPFTIQLLYETEEKVQPVSLGIDAGSKVIGVSATTETEVLYESEVELRDDISQNLATRKEFRTSRRNRKTRYRKPRFLNRVKSKHKNWIAPSVQAKVDAHLKVVKDVHQILPISKITVEVASFDIQKIQNPDIQGAEYQQGEQLGFWNVREYVLFRDNHTCQCCKGKSKDPILNVHHIESRKTGGDTPGNLVTLCETCHRDYHLGKIDLPKSIKRGATFKDAAFMGIMRWAFYNRLKELYPDVHLTYGYLTKNTRIRNGFDKAHYIDARCISGNPLAKPLDHYFSQKKVRCHNRQIHKATILKGGTRKRNQAPYFVHGFRLWDKVKFNGEECFIKGRRTSGYFALTTLNGTKITDSVSYKNLKLIETTNRYITERKSAIPPRLTEDGVSLRGS